MQSKGSTHPLVTAAMIAAGADFPFSHPLNPNSRIHFRSIAGKTMSEATGMKRVSVYTARIPPGRESFAYHSHRHEEEFLFVLSGRGVLEVGDEQHEIGPGDFAGFAAGEQAPGHLVRNPFDSYLVLLMGGERREMEVADFPRLSKRLIRTGATTWLVDTGAMTPAFEQAE